MARDLIWHNGGTGGYRTFIGFDPIARIGIVVLSNAGTAAGPDDIGRHLLDGNLRCSRRQRRREHEPRSLVDPQVFDRYVGRYQLAPTAILSVTREDSHFSRS